VLEYLDTGDRRPLTDDEQEAWLVALTDLRLAMGVRLGVTDETFDAFPNPNDPAQWPLAVLHYLGSLQEKPGRRARRLGTTTRQTGRSRCSSPFARRRAPGS